MTPVCKETCLYSRGQSIAGAVLNAKYGPTKEMNDFVFTIFVKGEQNQHTNNENFVEASFLTLDSKESKVNKSAVSQQHFPSKPRRIA